jgi:chromosome segregation ATPase
MNISNTTRSATVSPPTSALLIRKRPRQDAGSSHAASPTASSTTSSASISDESSSSSSGQDLETEALAASTLLSATAADGPNELQASYNVIRSRLQESVERNSCLEQQVLKARRGSRLQEALERNACVEQRILKARTGSRLRRNSNLEQRLLKPRTRSRLQEVTERNSNLEQRVLSSRHRLGKLQTQKKQDEDGCSSKIQVLDQFQTQTKLQLQEVAIAKTADYQHGLVESQEQVHYLTHALQDSFFNNVMNQSGMDGTLHDTKRYCEELELYLKESQTHVTSFRFQLASYPTRLQSIQAQKLEMERLIQNADAQFGDHARQSQESQQVIVELQRKVLALESSIQLQEMKILSAQVKSRLEKSEKTVQTLKREQVATSKYLASLRSQSSQVESRLREAQALASQATRDKETVSLRLSQLEASKTLVEEKIDESKSKTAFLQCQWKSSREQSLLMLECNHIFLETLLQEAGSTNRELQARVQTSQEAFQEERWASIKSEVAQRQAPLSARDVEKQLIASFEQEKSLRAETQVLLSQLELTQSSHQQFETQFNVATQQMQKLRPELHQINNRVDEVQETTSASEAKLEQSQQEMQHLQSKWKTSLQNVEALEVETKTLYSQLKQLQLGIQLLVQAESKNVELERRLQESEQQVTALKLRSTALDSRAMESDKVVLEDLLLQAETKLLQAERRLATVREQVTRLESGEEACGAQIQAMDPDKCSRESRVQDAELKNADVQGSYQVAQDQVEASQSQLETVDHDNVKLCFLLKEAETAVAQMTERWNASQVDVKTLQLEKSQYCLQLQEAESDVEAKEDVLQEAETRIRELRKELCGLEETLEAAQAETSVVQGMQVKAESRTIEEVESQRKEQAALLRNETEDMNLRLSQLTRDKAAIEDQQGRLKDSESAVVQLESQLEETQELAGGLRRELESSRLHIAELQSTKTRTGGSLEDVESTIVHLENQLKVAEDIASRCNERELKSANTLASKQVYETGLKICQLEMQVQEDARRSQQVVAGSSENIEELDSAKAVFERRLRDVESAMTQLENTTKKVIEMELQAAESRSAGVDSKLKEVSADGGALREAIEHSKCRALELDNDKTATDGLLRQAESNILVLEPQVNDAQKVWSETRQDEASHADLSVDQETEDFLAFLDCQQFEDAIPENSLVPATSQVGEGHYRKPKEIAALVRLFHAEPGNYNSDVAVRKDEPQQSKAKQKHGSAVRSAALKESDEKISVPPVYTNQKKEKQLIRPVLRMKITLELHFEAFSHNQKAKYSGPLLYGLPHGVGALRFQNGDIYSVEFRMGEMKLGEIEIKQRGHRHYTDIFKSGFLDPEFTDSLSAPLKICVRQTDWRKLL